MAAVIFEGGGMRGAYTTGVIDSFLDAGVRFDNVYGVSAGSGHAMSFLSRQRGRAFQVSHDYIDDPRYMGLKNLIFEGNFFSVKMIYDTIPNQLVYYDYAEFGRFPGKFYASVTNRQTGQAGYMEVSKTDFSAAMDVVAASSAVPLLARSVQIQDEFYFDGGIADSIPIRRSIADGNEKNVLVLTRDAAYRKEKNKLMPLLAVRYFRYPNLLHALSVRHEMYNDTLTFIRQEVNAGRAFIIQPSRPLDVGLIEHSAKRIEELYAEGLRDGMARADALHTFLAH